jgi:GH25 family lysozyme M1 (1,4-beta-N-acetylmuramidase)
MQSRNSANLPGIDISHYETGITLNDIAAQGKKIIFLKASEGSNIIDASFIPFNAPIRALGLRTGAYHFLHVYEVSTVDAQVENFLRQIKGQTLDCALCVDIEAGGYHDNLNPTDATAQVLDFAAKITAATGVKCIIYSGTNFINAHLTSAANLFDLWVADYRNSQCPVDNLGWKNWTGFQFGKGNVGGKTCDLNEFTPAVLVPVFCYGVPVPVPTPAPTPAPQPVPKPVPKPVPGPSGDPAVKTYQQELNRLHIGAPLVVDGVRGPITINAIKLFQSICGIAIDGVYGSQSDGAYQAIVSKPMLKQGSTGVAVRYIQYHLGCAIDGQFGAKTAAAVKGFQKASGLAADSIIGIQTWTKLIG